LLAWKRGDLYAVSQRLMAAFAISLVVVALVIWMTRGESVMAAFGFGLAFWVVFGSLTDLYLKAGIGKVAPKVAMARLVGLPRSVYGTALAHIGLGITLLGIVGVSTFGSERVLTMAPGDVTPVSGYQLRFEGVSPVSGSNYTENQGRFTLLNDTDKPLSTIIAAKRFYPARQMPTTESGISTRGFNQVYVALGDDAADGSIVVRIWWKPFVTLIWHGTLVMMLGGFISLLDRRLRVGAPAKNKTRDKTAVGRA
jgi:cytochrome c-type biogenesis protein CcmF